MLGPLLITLSICFLANVQYGYQQQLVLVPMYVQNLTTNSTNNTINNGWNNWNCEPHAYDLPGSHSLFAGCLHKNDSLLFHEIINKPSRLFTAREKTIEYPGVTAGHIRTERITAIRCYDLRGRGLGGFVRITRGGVGQRNVTLYLTSGQRNRSLNYRVEIYGRK